ncbi:histidine kinase [Allomuricauda taeanensis]|uniref:histidine kinase n=1 Tax=Flagellimonas taeanensis TaxID=1005926 RepID=UPI002E7B78E4|nr:histidine kinase [Allomuricauda taeanensis]MEE1961668.1 histidine kinase [Allomuricauda taeanensis]
MEHDRFEDVLIYFSKSLLGKEGEEDILWDMAKNCISKLGFEDCIIYLVDNNSDRLVPKAAHGPKSTLNISNGPMEIPMGQGISGHVAQTSRAEIVNDTSKDPRYIKDGTTRLSEICVPMTCDGVLYGVIDCEHPEPGFFTERHLKMLSAIASISAIKIKSVRDCKALMEERERLIQIKEEMVELKFKTLNSQLNPHFVFNALNSIQYFVTSEKKKLAMEYLSMFSKLIRFYLGQLGQESVSLREEIDMLHSYLNLQKLRYDGLFDYDISVQGHANNLEEATIPSLVVQTLFENIIESAMSHQQKGQHFEVLLKVTDASVVLDILHSSQNMEPANNLSGYREGILQWQDQINLLNTVKGYNIKNSVGNPSNGKRKITLELPKLL